MNSFCVLDTLELHKMSREFYLQLPHKQQTDITDKRAIAEKQDLCQVRGPTGWDVGEDRVTVVCSSSPAAHQGLHWCE